MFKIIVNLDSTKYENNNNCTYQINHIHNALLMCIFDHPEKDLSNVYGKLDMRQVHTSSINSSSPLFFCSIR